VNCMVYLDHTTGIYHTPPICSAESIVGIRTVGDVALLSSERIQQVATNQQLDREALTAFREACKNAFVQDFFQPVSRPFMPSAVGNFEDRQN
jgi:hypothetical protein